MTKNKRRDERKPRTLISEEEIRTEANKERTIGRMRRKEERKITRPGEENEKA